MTIRKQLEQIMSTQCPRCGSYGHKSLCSPCLADLTFEGRHGLEIPGDTWPIEGLARFRAQADLALIAGPTFVDEEDEDD